MEVEIMSEVKHKPNTNNSQPTVYTKAFGIFTGLIIIAIILFYFISSYIPYAQHKDLIDVKTKMIRISEAEDNIYAKTNFHATTQELFGKNVLTQNGYNIKVVLKPNSKDYFITAEQQDNNNTYPKCDKLVVAKINSTNKLFSYDTYGLNSKRCW
jgi:Tfp pilus assembly protein PilE